MTWFVIHVESRFLTRRLGHLQHSVLPDPLQLSASYIVHIFCIPSIKSCFGYLQHMCKSKFPILIWSALSRLVEYQTFLTGYCSFFPILEMGICWDSWLLQSVSNSPCLSSLSLWVTFGFKYNLFRFYFLVDNFAMPRVSLGLKSPIYYIKELCNINDVIFRGLLSLFFTLSFQTLELQLCTEPATWCSLFFCYY